MHTVAARQARPDSWPPEGESMAFKPNYSQQRAERDRVRRARKEEKLKQRQDRAAQRKAENAAPPAGDPSEDKR